MRSEQQLGYASPPNVESTLPSEVVGGGEADAAFPPPSRTAPNFVIFAKRRTPILVCALKRGLALAGTGWGGGSTPFATRAHRNAHSLCCVGMDLARHSARCAL